MTMVLGSAIRQFLRDLRTQKLRAALTLFGLVWGTAAVTLLLAFGDGLYQQLMVSWKGLGENIVICFPARTSKPWQGLPKGRPIRVTDADVNAVGRVVPGIKAISGEFSRGSSRFRVGRNVLVPGMVGNNPSFRDMRNLIPAEGGRYIDELDVSRRRRVIFLGNQLATDLFGPDAVVGRTVFVDKVPFLVVGVMKKKDQDSSYNGRDSDQASIPLTTYAALYGDKYVDDIVYQVEDAGQVERVKKDVQVAFARRCGYDPTDKEALLVWDTTAQSRFLDTFFLGFRLFLGIMGALTLVVAGIGVSNIMHVVVEERTKEVGLKMALGAHRSAIVGQFLVETLLLTAIGGGLGFLISWGVCAVFPSSGFQQFVGTPHLSLKVAAITTVILGSIGFLAGYFPARTASRLNPVEALRL